MERGGGRSGEILNILLYLISAPPLTRYLETFWRTHKSEAAVEEESVANISFGIPTITWIPLRIKATNASGSASKSFTFCILLSFNRSTTVDGFNLWEETDPQFTPIADSVIGSENDSSNVVVITIIEVALALVLVLLFLLFACGIFSSSK